jgi:adenylate cyclase
MRRGIKGLLLAVMIGLVGSLFGISPYGAMFERNIGLGWLFNARGSIQPPSETVVIAIDGFTGEKLGIPELPREWPRSIHGELVDALVELGVSTIVFDLDFHRPRSAADEQVFADAIERSERVVLFQQLIGKGHPLEDKTGMSHGDLWIEKLLVPIPELSNAVRGMGPFPLPRSEASVYEFWVFKSSAQEMATMPAVALQVHALKRHDQFYRLLDKSGLTDFVEIPESASNISTSHELRDLMIGLRSAVKANPVLKDSIFLELTRPWVSHETAETRQLLRSLVSVYIGNDKRFLNFYGPPGTIETIPYQAVIDGQLTNQSENAPDLNGKIAFVGYSDFYDPNQPDRFHTVFTTNQGFDLSGVEIAATAFANLLHGQSLRLPNALTILLILCFFGFFISLLIYFAPASLGVPAVVIISAGYVYYAQVRFDDSYLWLPLATPVLVQLPLALFVGLMAQYFGQRHKVRHISEAISVYLPEDVSRALISEDLNPEDTNQVSFSTCLATDMEGFTSISERMEPGNLAEFLNDYFDTLARPMKDNGVTVTDFHADAIMCAWTGQESDIEVRRKPILASLQAAEAIEDFRARHDAFESSLRIGMETGEVYIGHSGGGGNLGYCIVGDCANTASRIEGLNKYLKTKILATESLVEGLDIFLTRPMGQFVFVGKTKPLSIIEILSLSDEATEKQFELCERFARAIEYFLRGDWEMAAEKFESILEGFADDGPARFYLSQCQQRIRGAPVSDSPFVIRMQAK